MQSEHILDNVKLYPSLAEAIADLDRVITFSRRVGKTKPIDMTPAGMAECIHKLPYLQIGMFYVRETFGLTDPEADLYPLRCRIPTGTVIPSLNLAQSVAITTWVIFRYPIEQRNPLKASKGKDFVQIRDYMIDVLRSIGSLRILRARTGNPS